MEMYQRQVFSIYLQIQLSEENQMIDPSLVSLNEEPIDDDTKFLLQEPMSVAEIRRDSKRYQAEIDLEESDEDHDEILEYKTDQQLWRFPEQEELEEGEIIEDADEIGQDILHLRKRSRHIWGPR